MKKPLDLVYILKKEVIPALGCTEPIAVALAAATAKSKVKGQIKSIKIDVSPNIYKNGMAVGIPGVNKVGLEIAAALGAIAGNPSLKLEVLANITPDKVKQAIALTEKGNIEVDINCDNGNLYIDVEVITEEGVGKCKIKNRHEDICCIEVNGKVIFENKLDGETEKGYIKQLQKTSITEIIKSIEEIPYEDIEFLLEGAKMNKAIAKVGLEEGLGMGVGASILQNIKKGILADDIFQRTVLLTAAGSDARMSGYQMPVMSSAGSGNHGLTAILPVVAVAEMKEVSEEKLARALAISHLVTVYIKSFTGNLSALCGCAVAAATGASVAIVWILGGNYLQMGGTIKNMVADVTGVICDGAKTGCAFKLSTAAAVALKSALLALDDVIATPDNGIVTDSVEQTIKNLGRIGTPGMVETDREILEVMMEKNKLKIIETVC
ncbi:serine dehydratase subunit alpha family protein [Alkalicella caledoniensis]|uniref:UPF0597 protein HYG86_15310 n=1 Tax=Alkalicella caledoniensis TaxID=2731377 RepID=A0A7G9WBH5_ALKCA|nr:L-serine ammonia-lyase, iron-sulfur-dependent, subunit alpha [Alkalicella caledoniensis]QNO16037.1 serine dehydratase subunit alpha family protein [Alkalicella caledoniensis]